MSTKAAEKEVAVSKDGNLPSFLLDDVTEYAGAGMSDRQEDFVLPFLAIAQANSPQLKRQQADAYIPGLEPGDIFNTATRKFWKSDTGLLLIHACYQKADVEWVHRDHGGGYVATHPMDSKRVAQVRLGGKSNRERFVPDEKGNYFNHLVETGYHFAITVDDLDAVVVACASTNLGTSRLWNTQMKNAKIRDAKGNVQIAPSWGRLYRLYTVYKKNDLGDWFQYAVEDMGWVQSDHLPAMNEAKKFYLAQKEAGGVPMGRPPVDNTPVVATVDGEVDGDEPPI